MSNITAGKALGKLIYCSRLNNALNETAVSSKYYFPAQWQSTQKKCKMFRVYCKKATTSMGRGIVYKIIELFLHAKLGFKRYNSSSTLLQIWFFILLVIHGVLK